VAVVVGILTLAASVSRSSAIALGVGLAALIIRLVAARAGFRRFLPVIAAVAVAGIGLYLTSGIWSARLSSKLTAGFDRPATWVSGLRIASDHPLTGVGPNHVADTVTSAIRYTYTPYGATFSNPHNTWIYAMAAEGFPYGLVLLLATVFLVWALVAKPGADGAEYLAAGLLASGLVFAVNNLFTHPDNMIFVLLAAAVILERKRRAPGPLT
jgi:O-antigen ligase